MIEVSEVFIARLGELSQSPDKIIGFAIVRREYGAYLWSLAVDPENRSCGVANRILDYAETFCHEAGDKTIRLHVKFDNPAQKLYFDRGYRVYDLARSYYGDGGPGLGLMMKKIL